MPKIGKYNLLGKFTIKVTYFYLLSGFSITRSRKRVIQTFTPSRERNTQLGKRYLGFTGKRLLIDLYLH